MMITLSNLKNLLSQNVCEIVFTRRRPRAGKPPQRRLLCTLDDSILNSTNGRLSLNYRPPGSAMSYDPASKNLLLVWDIFMQDWRMVNMDACDLVNTIPEKDFWNYFNNTLLKMSPQQKMTYMDS